MSSRRRSISGSGRASTTKPTRTISTCEACRSTLRPRPAAGDDSDSRRENGWASSPTKSSLRFSVAVAASAHWAARRRCRLALTSITPNPAPSVLAVSPARLTGNKPGGGPRSAVYTRRDGLHAGPHMLLTIVGIGASAGGLEAIAELRFLPRRPGWPISSCNISTPGTRVCCPRFPKKTPIPVTAALSGEIVQADHVRHPARRHPHRALPAGLFEPSAQRT